MNNSSTCLSASSYTQQHSCSQCTRTFKRKNDLTRHAQTVHNKIKPSCLKCGRAFTTNRALKRHLKYSNNCAPSNSNAVIKNAAPDTVQPNSERHACVQCDRTYVTLRNLRRHIVSTHDVSVSIPPEKTAGTTDDNGNAQR